MATKIDYYAALEVSRDANGDEIKRAYRKLAMKYHPDRNPGDADAENKFKEISEAYDVLKDDQKRAAYDRFGHAAFEGGGPGAGGFDFGGGGLGDIFEQMFGDMMGGRRGGRRSGADIQVQVTITFAEAFAGVKKEITIPTRVTCKSCDGTGSADKDQPPETCPSCHGAGKVRAQQGFFAIERPCPTCHGTGRLIRNPCKECHGAGTVEKNRVIEVAIPAGVEDGTRIRITGEGEAGGKGVPAGDLYVHVSVEAHAIFQRDGANIYCRVPVRMGQAALGTEIEVPVVDGSRAKVKIPAGTQTGEHFRLRGKGFSVLRSSARGDMYIQVVVETPRHLSKRQRELLEEFETDAAGHAKGSPESTGFFSKVKDFFEGKL
ncbi:molecular chaperone DnaJ [Komagataeibacter nataicola]|uniref:Chaperone protein DnaJ n=1 Tax=Komagataeibacter nataicola TaxID=265960 RepID=A0A9N7CLK3_9PROT|nr:molecular chaperone DnaJ [Komagataeibacter nataicola]AQU87638.1 molecular chaperone DnaJ [Komagataeibacter nataicola]PYD66994.1 molecular chaperone DnaJ [Komagataeibacter nataicola]WEQ55374.1 molecular chaperone DnaJ [Komagataeibacter nataicola]WNM09757.1 molecular chaperone DnaJ [Komagataeibacter nataicola]GBR17814.1 molecular chaperone DnaJ [Komagataeibacter nataicola NRIC 0616]